MSAPSIVTHVGHASWGDNLYRGYGVLNDLAGTDGFWSMISMSLGGPRLEPRQCRVLDELSTCSFAADPRVWPMKAVRMGAAYGSVTAGLCVGLLAVDHARMGPAIAGGAAKIFVGLMPPGEPMPPTEGLHTELDALVASGSRLDGFGVPFRPRDERVDALRRCMAAHPEDEGPYWRLMNAVDEYLAAHHRLPINIAGAAAAVALDLGFRPRQITHLPAALLLSNFLANAYEGAAQRPAVLQRLPDAVIEYVGEPDRRSPRALAAEPGG
ncbi:MAG: hypothetical protein AAF799_35075 [Myxococcota bacterium]